MSVKGYSQSYFYSLGLGGNLFKGDVQSWNIRPTFGQLKTIRPSIQGEFGLQLNKTFDVSLRLGLGLLHADPAANPLPIVSNSASAFNSPLVELALLGDYNFFDFLPKEQTNFNWTPYFISGIAGFTTSGVKSLAIPYGVGIKWKLNKKIMLRFESVARKTLTDRIDSEGFTTSSYNFGNSDQYINTNISIVYSVYPIICPRID